MSLICEGLHSLSLRLYDEEQPLPLSKEQVLTSIQRAIVVALYQSRKVKLC